MVESETTITGMTVGDINDMITTIALPEDDYKIDPKHLRSIPFGVLTNTDGSSAKKRCRCIEKKRRKVVKEIKYIPLAPVVQMGGNPRNFTCKCSHLRKVVKNQIKPMS